MLVNATKAYSNHVGALESNQVQPQWRILQLIRCSLKCLHLGEIKRFCHNIPQFVPKSIFVQDYPFKFCLEQSTKVENS